MRRGRRQHHAVGAHHGREHDQDAQARPITALLEQAHHRGAQFGHAGAGARGGHQHVRKRGGMFCQRRRGLGDMLFQLAAFTWSALVSTTW